MYVFVMYKKIMIYIDTAQKNKHHEEITLEKQVNRGLPKHFGPSMNE